MFTFSLSVGWFKVSSNTWLMENVLVREEWLVPFSVKAELCAGEVMRSIPSWSMISVEPVLASGAMEKSSVSLSARPVCMEVSFSALEPFPSDSISAVIPRLEELTSLASLSSTSRLVSSELILYWNSYAAPDVFRSKEYAPGRIDSVLSFKKRPWLIWGVASRCTSMSKLLVLLSSLPSPI